MLENVLESSVPFTEADSSPQLQELSRDDAHCACACGNVLVVYSKQEPTHEYCQRSARATLEYARAYPSGLGMLVIIAENEPPPSESARRAIIDCYAMIREVITCGVLVVEGEGFAASAKRSVITLISMTVSVPFPIKVAPDIVEGASKLAKLLGPRLDPRLDTHAIAAAAASTKPRLHAS